MTSLVSEFKLFDRGFKDTILLIPGWATDYRIFNSLDLKSNYLMPIKFSPFNFTKNLLDSLRENGLVKISILGWSMGSFLALDAASKYPDIIKDNIFMVSMKRRYESETIERIKTYLKENKAGYLYKFYREFFSEDEVEALSWFKKNLLKNYLNEMNLDYLLEGLDYLLNAHVKMDGLEKLNIRFVHGEADKIAPIRDALEIWKGLPQAKFISIKRAGHAPFLNPAFSHSLTWLD